MIKILFYYMKEGNLYFFKKNHLKISLSNRMNTIDIDIDNRGKPLTKKNIDIAKNHDCIEIKNT